MATIVDLNLLAALDALLQEGSVTRAAARAHLTTPAMSRALGRLRHALGDELLVRAGREMVLTPRAAALRERVHRAAAEARALLDKGPETPLAQVARTLVVRCSDGVAAILVGPLAAAARAQAPGLRLVFAQEGAEDAAALREGRVELDVGVVDFREPELRTTLLFRDRFVGVARKGGGFVAGKMPPQRRFAGHAHVAVSRRGRPLGPIDHALAARALVRTVAATVPDFLAALHAVAGSDLITAVPASLARQAGRSLPIVTFPLPVQVPEVPVSMAWHPRFDDEPAHRWLRAQIQRWVGAQREAAPKPVVKRGSRGARGARRDAP